jgi:hypothetical protein
MFTIRPATEGDLPRILKIYAHARSFMVQSGNATQWVNGYPQPELLTQDIAEKQLYVLCKDEYIHGVFVFFIGEDPTYLNMEGGSWRTDAPYGVIHRIASDGSGGIFPAALAFCRNRIGHIRIDTHRDNLPMQHVLDKAGFSRRGTIHLSDGSPRIAYDLI